MAKKKQQPKNIYLDEYQRECRRWCINNGIIVRPEPRPEGITITVEVLGKRTTSPNRYTNDEYHEKNIQLYVYLYEKYNIGI